jgi:hypothetical protein
LARDFHGFPANNTCILRARAHDPRSKQPRAVSQTIRSSMPESNKLNFPKITKVTLDHFSLYTLKSSLEFPVSAGVFCLAGANGLGKSTFLAAVNFCLTGIVPNPSETFLGLEDFLEDRSEFSKDYFTGRISEKDRKAAEVTLEFMLVRQTYVITRGVFEADGLREFLIYDTTERKDRKKIFDTSRMSPAKRQKIYAEKIVDAIGLDSFEQFAFLQHFVFTFDERRELVFWTPKVLERALYLAFGVDPKLATQADKIRRDWDREGSYVRNTTQEAKNVADRIKFFEGELSSNSINDPSEYDVVAQSEKLTNERDKIQSLVFRLKTDLNDAELKLANLSATQLSLRSEYETEFNKHIRSNSMLSLNPIVTNSIDRDQCSLCGTGGATAIEMIKLKTSANTCPLCNSVVKIRPPDSESIRLLKQIDKKLNKAKEDFDEVYASKQRITSDLEQSDRALQKAERAISVFERTNAAVLERLRLAGQSPNELNRTLERLRERWKELDEKKKRHYEKRDEKKAQLVRLQRKLSAQYTEAEKDFVPLFRELAVSFIGIELDVALETKETKTEAGVNLVLTLKESTRRREYQLSESQKYFIDIALRMALAQHMSGTENKATLFIDTPEGSLDIAYEKGAGDMFARFVKSGHHILMTANINSSQILRTLADDCGPSMMHIEPMINWTTLSSVQKRDPQLFTKTLKPIQDKLRVRTGRAH